MDIADDAKEHAEHIGENVGKIHHQREHLASLGEDLKDLIDLFGTSQTLYQDHCPMFNDGTVWFSENKEIKNPYYGSRLLPNVQLMVKVLFGLAQAKQSQTLCDMAVVMVV
jgi:uncharacterized membrane protein YfbV (UPF0208 family)